MNQNRTKRGLELGAAIIALVYCSVDLIISLIDIISLGEYLHLLEPAYIVGLILGIALVATEMILAIKILIVGYSFNSKKRLRIAFIVFTSILVFFLFILIVAMNSTGLTIVALLIFIAALVLESIAISLKDNVNANEKTVDTTASKPSIEAKINELKHLLDLGVITQEQYEAAVDKAVKEII